MPASLSVPPPPVSCALVQIDRHTGRGVLVGRPIVARPAVDGVIARAAEDVIVAVAAEQGVVTRIAGQDVVARATPDRVVPAEAVEGVVVRAAIQDVSAFRTMQFHRRIPRSSPQPKRDLRTARRGPNHIQSLREY
jgi:hypothetical protein